MLFNSKKSGFKLLSLLFVVGLTFAACSQDVDGQIGNLQSQIDKEAAARSEAVSKLEDQLKSLQATHAADIKKLQDAQEELSKAIENAEKAAKEFASAQADAAEAAAKAYADAQDAVVLATAKAAAAEAEANAKAYTEAQIATLKATLEQEITNATAELRAKHEADIAALQAKDAELEQAIAAAETKLNQKIDAEIARIEKAHKADIDRLDAAIDALQGQVNDILAWETTAKTQIAANETAIAALQGDLAAVKGDLATETSDRKKADDALQTALNTLGSKVDANYSELIAKIEELIKADDALYAAIVDNAKKIKDLQDADVELGKRIDGVVADLKKATEDINAEIVKICGKIDDLYDKYDAAAKEIAALKEKNNQQDKDIQAAIAKAEKELAEARTEITNEISAAVTKANGYTDTAVANLKIALEAVDAELRGSITVLSGTPTTLIFKPLAYRNGIETVVFEPIFYSSWQNPENDKVTADLGIDLSLVPDFDHELKDNKWIRDYDPYLENSDVNNKVKWINTPIHFVNLPAEVHYWVNPSNVSINSLNLHYPYVKFPGNVAEVSYTRAEEDVDGFVALNYNSHYDNTIEGQTLKFRVDLVGKGISDTPFLYGTTDFANNDNGKKSFNWPTFADFAGKQNPNFYSGRVDACYYYVWEDLYTLWSNYDNSKKQEFLDDLNSDVISYKTYLKDFASFNKSGVYAENPENLTYVFATQIPFASEDPTVKGKSVVSDYAQVAIEPASSYFDLVPEGKTDKYFNPNKHDAFVKVSETQEGKHKPVYTGEKSPVVYDLYAGYNNGIGYGFDPEVAYSLLDYVDLREFRTEYDGGHDLSIVDDVRLEDLGFQFRFYVPTYDGVANVDFWGQDAPRKSYKAPHYGPYEYYFGSSKIDFQNYLTVGAKDGVIKIKDWNVSKGFAPVVLAQVIDTRRPYAPVVTEAYFRLVIKGQEVFDKFEYFDFPACDKPNIEVEVPSTWFANNVYKVFNNNIKKFNYYFDAKIKEATPNTFFQWRKWNDEADHSKGYVVKAEFYWNQETKEVEGLTDEAIATLDDKCYLVMCTPFADLKYCMTETAMNNITTITWTLGGNVVSLELNAKAALPVIQLAYSDSYWDKNIGMPKHGDADFFAPIIANPNPASEQSSEKYCSFDYDLTTGFNHFEQPQGFVQDPLTKIYYKATFNGRDVSADVAKCYSLDIVPALYNVDDDLTPVWFNYGTKDEASNAPAVLASTKNSDGKYNTDGVIGDWFRYSFSKNVTYYRTLGNKVNGTPYFAYSDALWYRNGSSYGPHNILLKEAEGITHTPALSSVTIDTPWGFQKGIDLLEGDYDVPCLVFAKFTDGGAYEEYLAIEQFKLDYKKPIIVTNKQAEPFEFVDITHKDQIIKTTDVVALTDWLGNPVKAEKVAITHTHGKFTPEELSAYYNVDNPYFVADQDGNPVYKTDLKVNADGTYTHQCIGDFTDFSKINALKGQLPDKTVLKFDGEGNIYYQNAGASLDQAYHIFVQVNVPHKWGVAHGWVVIQVNPNKK